MIEPYIKNFFIVLFTSGSTESINASYSASGRSFVPTVVARLFIASPSKDDLIALLRPEPIVNIVAIIIKNISSFPLIR